MSHVFSISFPKVCLKVFSFFSFSIIIIVTVVSHYETELSINLLKISIQYFIQKLIERKITFLPPYLRGYPANPWSPFDPFCPIAPRPPLFPGTP